MTLNLLVTACRAPAGRSVMLLLEGDGRVQVTGADVSGPADRLLPFASEAGYVGVLSALARDQDHVLVTNDEELWTLAHARVPEDLRAKLLHPHPHALTIALDKALLYEQFSALCPRPAFLKPRRKPREVPENVLAIERLDPPEWSLDALYWHGELIAAVARRRDVIERNVARVGLVAPRADLVALLERVNEPMPLHGIVNAQFMFRGEEPVLTDLNLRPPGGLTISAAAGVNMPRLLVDLLIDGTPRRPTVPVFGEYKTLLETP